MSLSGCALFGDNSSGQASTGFRNGDVAGAYVPLQAHALGIFQHWGAAVVVAPHVAATNAHNAPLLDSGSILAVSKDYDLLFFRTDKAELPRIATAEPGERVIAYGQGSDKDLREAAGAVRAVNVRVGPRCSDCETQKAITYDAAAGPGFSGGPLVDAQTGAVVGITFGYQGDNDGDGPHRQMYAYGMDLVLAEMHRLLGQNAPDS